MERSGIVLEKVAEYFYYNYRNRDAEDVPDMDIPPELCLELLMAADFLDSELKHSTQTHIANLYLSMKKKQDIWPHEQRRWAYSVIAKELVHMVDLKIRDLSFCITANAVIAGIYPPFIAAIQRVNMGLFFGSI